MAKSGHRSSRPPPASRSAPVSSKLSPVAAIQEEAQKAAKELVVDDFVDTYLRERPKTRNPYEPIRVAAPAAPAPPPSSSVQPSRSAEEESGIRPAIAHAHREEVRRPTVEVEAVAVAGADGEVVALEAELAERDERIESLQQELKRLRDSVNDEAAGAQPRAAPPVPVPAPPVLAPPVPAPPVPAPPAPAPPVPAPPVPAPPVPAAPVAVKPPAAAPPAPPPAQPALDVPAAPPTSVAARRSPLRPALGILLLVGAVGALVTGVARLATDGVAPEPAVDARRPEPEVAPPRAEEPAPRPATPRAAGEPAHAPPAEETGAPTTASAPLAPQPAPAAPPEPEDAPDLLSFQGYLTVASSTDAEVVVQGQPAGRTNQRLLTRCGPRNVRLRDGATWITEGEHVRIVCMKHTSIRLEPSGGRR